MNITEARVRLRQNANEMRVAVREFDRAVYDGDFVVLYDTANQLRRLAEQAADICMHGVTEDSDDIQT